VLNTDILILGVWKFSQTAQQQKKWKVCPGVSVKKLNAHYFPPKKLARYSAMYFSAILPNWFVSPADYNQPGTKPTQI